MILKKSSHDDGFEKVKKRNGDLASDEVPRRRLNYSARVAHLQRCNGANRSGTEPDDLSDMHKSSKLGTMQLSACKAILGYSIAFSVALMYKINE